MFTCLLYSVAARGFNSRARHAGICVMKIRTLRQVDLAGEWAAGRQVGRQAAGSRRPRGLAKETID